MKQNSTPFDVTEYDRQIKRTLPFYEEMFQQVIDIVRTLNLQSLRWLDVGCGTGKMAGTALDNFDIQKMVCIDVEKEMLERARELCNDEKVEFLQCDARELPYQKMFDIVTAIQINHYFRKEERITTIKNCYDALAENGIYISFENFAPYSGEGAGLYLERWKEFQIANGKTKEEALSHIGRYGRDYFPVTIPESIELLKECGFRMVEIFWVSYMQVGILARK
ncbi:MAG: class I SAM-dependent methyltransferase [Lachnospiraceae bacterium]|nr:class I SAM-dependent methyltransferase [Lachnospiraceae bacterium]